MHLIICFDQNCSYAVQLAASHRYFLTSRVHSVIGSVVYLNKIARQHISYSDYNTAGPHIRRCIVPALAVVNEAAYLNRGYKKNLFRITRRKKIFRGKLHSVCRDRCEVMVASRTRLENLEKFLVPSALKNESETSL